jgi:hypothetical protein
MIDTQEIVQETDWAATVTVTDETGAVVNLTGSSVTFMVELAGTVYTCGAYLTTAASGLITINVSRSVTAKMKPDAVGTGQVMLVTGSGVALELLRFPVRTIDTIEATT